MRNLPVVLFLVVCLGAYGQKSKGPVFHWRTASPGEMPADVTDFSPLDKGKLLYYLSNNDEFMFVDIVVTDPGVQKKILDIGMNLWIDVTGKEKRSVSVRYPVGAGTVRSQLERKGDRITEEELLIYTRNSGLAMAYEIHLNGFGDGGAKVIPCSSEEGCMASLRYNDDGELIYFLSIPVNEIVFEESKGEPVPFSIGIEYGVPPVIERPRPQSGASGGAAVSPGAGSGGRGGGPPAGGASRGGASGTGQSTPVEDQTIWIKGLLLASGIQ